MNKIKIKVDLKTTTKKKTEQTISHKVDLS